MDDKTKQNKKKKESTKGKGKKKSTKPAENGGGELVKEGEEENKENLEGEKKKKVVVKKSIPGWATLSEEAKKRLVHSKVSFLDTSTDLHLTPGLWIRNLYLRIRIYGSKLWVRIQLFEEFALIDPHQFLFPCKNFMFLFY